MFLAGWLCAVAKLIIGGGLLQNCHLDISEMLGISRTSVFCESSGTSTCGHSERNVRNMCGCKSWGADHNFLGYQVRIRWDEHVPLPGVIYFFVVFSSFPLQKDISKWKVSKFVTNFSSEVFARTLASHLQIQSEQIFISRGSELILVCPCICVHPSWGEKMSEF